MERLLRFFVVSFPVAMPSNGEEATGAAASTTPSITNVVATNTVANSEISPQDDPRSDVQSLQDYRSAASVAIQPEHQRDEVFSETPQSQLHVANGSQTVSQVSLQSSRELRGLESVNNAGRKESLALSESSRSKRRPTLDAAKKDYESALAKMNQEIKEFLETYPANVFVPTNERPETKIRYKDIKDRRGALGCGAKELRVLLNKHGMAQERNELERTLENIDAQISTIRSEHYEYLSHGTSTLASQSIANRTVQTTPSQTASQASLTRRKMLEAEAREKEEKRMADIQIQRIRMNATLDAQESESRVMADMDRDRIERILLTDEDPLKNSIQAYMCRLLPVDML